MLSRLGANSTRELSFAKLSLQKDEGGKQLIYLTMFAVSKHVKPYKLRASDRVKGSYK